ncbi:transcriptional regulator, TetR family [Methylobacterium sp. 4-46]|uniref:TetR family transcriptional regulator n=1 Tax=unclassified Methylobacterium TaxID=2615210 RepID=UPI000152DAFC|nr:MULTISPECIES: TetR family transcriptional regulator [Methylobacterium]ACA17407.1 transcriptional regulator, TetR family [Methylobacterium sp. 4-46]WFT83093.1 TetR family transcriptional regulator [Methylobacterium nodulans]
MRVSKEAAAASRVRIVEAASRLLRERGIEATSIADVMEAAGMTHGGFYKHFRSKDDLVAAALGAAFAGHADRFDRRRAREGAAAALAAYLAEYLSADHVAHPGVGCPVAALGIDAGRGSAEVAAALARGVEDIVARVAAAEPDGRGPARARAAAIRRLAAMVGAVVVARGVGPGPLRDEVLAACSDAAGGPPDGEASRTKPGADA